jgi:diguanylate cyclase (GGDEF)-like protein
MDKLPDTDWLTGLLRRRHGMEELRRVVDEVGIVRGTSSVGVIFADIFRLKSPHDKYGHPPIDDAIRDVGHVVQSVVRKGDIACRYGGDEFLLIMPDVTEEEVRQRAEQLRQATAQVQIMSQGQPQERVALSVGVAHYPSIFNPSSRSKLQHAEALMRAADEDLERDRKRNAQRET